MSITPETPKTNSNDEASIEQELNSGLSPTDLDNVVGGATQKTPFK